jgi:hypothetical protein
MNAPSGNMRPCQLGLLLLASGESLPRPRARDQRADVAGSRLKQRVLGRLIELDPEPDDVGDTLRRIVDEMGEPTGPTRAVAQLIADEFLAIRDNPRLAAWLLDQAVRPAP